VRVRTTGFLGTAIHIGALEQATRPKLGSGMMKERVPSWLNPLRAFFSKCAHSVLRHIR
jgi:hypothetical protein